MENWKVADGGGKEKKKRIFKSSTFNPETDIYIYMYIIFRNNLKLKIRESGNYSQKYTLLGNVSTIFLLNLPFEKRFPPPPLRRNLITIRPTVFHVEKPLERPRHISIVTILRRLGKFSMNFFFSIVHPPSLLG